MSASGNTATARAESSSAWRSVAIVLALTISGTLSGALLGMFGRYYSATIAIPFNGDVSFFHKVKQEYDAPARRNAHAESLHTPRDKADFDEFGKSRATLDHVFRVTRRDLLDVPEFTTKVLGSIADSGSSGGSLSILRLTVRASAPEKAQQIALAGARFVRNTTALVRLAEILQTWGSNERAIRARETAWVENQAEVASLTRMIAAMDKLRQQSLSEFSDGPHQNAAQVQVTGANFLSPSQQLVGLQSSLIDKQEKGRLIKQDYEYLSELRTFASGKSNLDFDSVLRAAKALDTDTDNSKASLGALKASTEILLRLTEVEEKIVTAPLEPPMPLVAQGGFGLPLLSGLGCLLAFLIGIGFVYIDVLKQLWGIGDHRPERVIRRVPAGQATALVASRLQTKARSA